MSAKRYRLIALGLPGTIEGSHQGHADFRVSKRIFATLGYPDKDWGMVKLTPEQQTVLVEIVPDVFRPVPGGWGKHGSTNIRLANADQPTMRSALTLAWDNIASKQKIKSRNNAKL
jgi:hypothetical protein